MELTQQDVTKTALAALLGNLLSPGSGAEREEVWVDVLKLNDEDIKRFEAVTAANEAGKELTKQLNEAHRVFNEVKAAFYAPITERLGLPEEVNLHLAQDDRTIQVDAREAQRYGLAILASEPQPEQPAEAAQAQPEEVAF